MTEKTMGLGKELAPLSEEQLDQVHGGGDADGTTELFLGCVCGWDTGWGDPEIIEYLMEDHLMGKWYNWHHIKDRQSR